MPTTKSPRSTGKSRRKPSSQGSGPESNAQPESIAVLVEPAPDKDKVRGLPADTDMEILDAFIAEALEYLEESEACLLALEANPEDIDAVNTVFRGFHTIKGTSAFLELTWITELAHRAESLLNRVREREIQCQGGYADLAFRSSDMLKALIAAVRTAIAGQPMTKPAGYIELMEVLENPEAAGVSIASSSPTESTDEDESDSGAARRGQENRRDSSVRVATDRLDQLIDMVGELVIAQSMIAQDETVTNGGHYQLIRKVGHNAKIVRELQDLSLSLRMVPLKATFQKMSRLVRDLTKKNGKRVRLVTEDNDTEIDRNMVDVINDLLVHMVRNSIDHGIETTGDRKAAGKPGQGTLRLSAYHSGGSVVVEIVDDGRGLDRERIIEKALSKGLIESGKNLSDPEVYNLIFEPGFSTAAELTDVSGRGVGMDVVRRGVERLRGRIDIESAPGEGTTFSVRLPLTLAITDGMLVGVGQERFIIPTASIQRTFRLTPDDVSTIGGRGEMVTLRDETMPVFRLHRLFNVPGAVSDLTEGLLVVIGDRTQQCALLVDELLGQQQVVAKSLTRGLGKVQGVSGAAILGDGRVGLILDPAGIVSIARQAV